MTSRAARVTDALLPTPRVHPANTSVGAARAFFTDDHVHAMLLVAEGALVAVVERGDLIGVPAGVPAMSVGRLSGRMVGPGLSLEETRRAMAARAQRRLAVVDHHGMLLGLLCLKHHGQGFCTATDVAARDGERRATEWSGRPSRPNGPGPADGVEHAAEHGRPGRPLW